MHHGIKEASQNELCIPQKNIYFFRKKKILVFPLILPGNKVLLVLPPPPPYRIRFLWTLQKRRRCVIAVPFFILLDPWPWLCLLAREMKGSRGTFWIDMECACIYRVYCAYWTKSVCPATKFRKKERRGQKSGRGYFFLARGTFRKMLEIYSGWGGVIFWQLFEGETVGCSGVFLGEQLKRAAAASNGVSVRAIVWTKPGRGTRKMPFFTHTLPFIASTVTKLITHIAAVFPL